MSDARVLLLSRRGAFREPLEQAFEKAGIVVVVTGDAEAAAAVFAEPDRVPVGVVIDLLTIDDDATDLCNRVRERKEAESIPILFIGTGQESIRSTTDALIAGGDGFFQLPVEAPRVVAKVAAYLGIPLPVLPHGLLVTIDDHDLLERTPEPSRIVVPAALPEDLLARSENTSDPGSPARASDNDDDRGDDRDGEDGDDNGNDTGNDTGNEGAPDMGGDLDGKTPPEGTPSLPEDFADVTRPYRLQSGEQTVLSPLLARGPASLEGASVPEAPDGSYGAAARAADDDDADALLEEHARHEAEERARLAAEEARERQNRAREADEEARLIDEERAVRAAEEQRLATLARLDEERLRDEARAHELAEQHAAELERVRLAHEEARKQQEELRARTEEQRRRADDEEARLRTLVAEREAAEAKALEADAQKEIELLAEEERLRQVEERRLRLEEEARVFAEEQQAQRALEEQRLQELLERRRAAEEQARVVEEEARRRRQEEAAELEILARRREEEERALLEQAEQQRLRHDDEQRRLEELARRRQLEEEELRAHLEAQQQRQLDEERQLDELARRREEEERALLEQQELQRRRQEEEARHFDELVAKRQALEVTEARAEDERRRRIAEEEERLAVLAEQRARLVAEQEQTARSHQEQEQHERERLAELEIARSQAEAELADARAASHAVVEQEVARLRALREEHARREEEARAVLADQQQRSRAEQERLDALAREKRQLEQRSVEQQKKSADDEMLARARLAELEIARLRAEEEVEQLLEDQKKKAHDDAVALAAAVDEARARSQQLEEEAARRQQTLREAAAVEEDRLAALRHERERREEELRVLEEQAREQVAAEEQRLKDLVAKSEAERHAAADDARRLEAAIAERAASADARLAEQSARAAALQEEAAREATRLAHLRAEEEAARAGLEENRSRARLAFVSGRFDAVLSSSSGGSVLTRADIGSDPRPEGDGTGLPFAGGVPRGQLGGVDVDDKEPPPPLPFVALEPVQGRFEDGELPSLLLSAQALQVTGAIDVVSDDGRTRTLFLEEGEPVFLASGLAADRAEEILLRGGLITAARHAELRAAPPTSARRMCARLVDDGVLKLDELFSSVRGVLTEQVMALLEWPSGTFQFKEERAYAADRVRLGHPLSAVVAEGVRRRYDEGRLWSVLGGPQTLIGPSEATPTSPLPPLSPEETLALSRLDGTRALDDVILESGLHAHTVLRAALIGVVTGASRVLARGLPRGPFEIIERREKGVAIDRARVIDRLQLARHGDYFTFLGVDVEATAFEVHRAAQRLRERFDPARYGDAAFSDLQAAVREIVDIVGDAEAVLADGGLRDAYKKNLRSTALAPSSSSSSKRSQQAG